MASSDADISRLTEEQQLALQQFTAVTDQGHEAAVPLLARCQWNVQIAISRFFDGEPADAADDLDPTPQDIRRQEVLMNGFSASSRASSSRESRTLSPAPRIVPQPDSQLAPRSAPLILSLRFAPLNLLYAVVSRGLGLLAHFFPLLSRLFPFRAPSHPSRHNTSGRRPLNSRDTAARFIREFEEEYGPHSIPFFENGYAQAYDAAKRDLKFLLVVLLSPEHDDTASFVRDTLLSPEVTAFIASNTPHSLVLWAGNVADPEAYQVSSELNCTKLPFSALIVHTPSQSATAMSTVLRLAGSSATPAQYAQKLQTAMTTHSIDLQHARSARQEQQASRNIVREQNSAYERSLAQDRERARLRREAEEAAEKAEKEARDRADSAEREGKNREQWRRWRVRSLRPEPGGDAKDAVRISVRLADGQRLVRKFDADARLEELYAFVECHDLLAAECGGGGEVLEKPEGWTHTYGFRLVSPMPRQVHEVGDDGRLRDRIGRSGNLIVERMEEDEE